MNVLTTKQLIIDYLIEKTEFYGIDHLQYFTTNRISYQLNISRSLTSQYLNELCKEQMLVKVSSRPVYYFYRKGLEKKYAVTLHEMEFYNINDLMNILSQEQYNKDDFYKVIGYEGSLHACISQMKSAMNYPPNGLPLVLQGEKNLETEYLVRILFQYCKNRNIISSDAKYRCIDVLSMDKDELNMELSFKEKGSSIDKVCGGILLIENAQLLDKSLQRDLAAYLSGHTKIKKMARIILAVREHTYESLEDHLRSGIPLVCDIPSWRHRNLYEKEQFLLRYFQKEEDRVHKPIRITENLFQVLLEYEFPENINEVKNTIRTICVNAWMDHEEDDVLDVNLTHLPSYIPVRSKVMNGKNKSVDMFLVDEKQRVESSERLLNFFDQLLNAHIFYQENHSLFSDFSTQGFELLREYYDFIVFDFRYEDERIRKMEELMNQTLKALEIQHQIILPINCSFVLARIVYRCSSKHHVIQLWENQRRNDISACLKSLMDHLPAEMMMAMEMSRALSSALDITLSDGNLIFLILNIHFYNRDIRHQDTCGLIISHGYSTASSIADACNHMLQTHVFKAIDMPMEIQVDQIITQISDFIKLYPYYQNLILMVDMGSLIELGNALHVNMNIGVINNISTGIALEIGNSILQHQQLEQILHDACEHSPCCYHIIQRQQKEKAVVFTNDAGIEVSKRMAALFQNSLIKPIDLKFIEYDYEQLAFNKEKDALFEMYDVALIVKPYTLELDTIPSLSLEDIVGFRDIDRLHSVLQEYMTKEEIEIFNEHLLKNFSLQSVMENLTILNPARLMDNISDAVGHLQRLMHQKFHSKTIAGIYIHVSFLIERLITKNAIETHEDLSVFEETQKQFIQDVNKSFEGMLKHYNVELPISEIAYLYDYILHDEQHMKKENK